MAPGTKQVCSASNLFDGLKPTRTGVVRSVACKSSGVSKLTSNDSRKMAVKAEMSKVLPDAAVA